MSNDQTIKVLNELISVCKDGARGFREASEHVTDIQLKTLLSELAVERDSVALALQTEVRDLGGVPSNGGSLMAVAHRLYMDFKSVISSKHDKVVIDEVERGEHYTLNKFQEALNKDLPVHVKSIVQLQCGQVQQSYDRIQALRRMMP